eukprot:3942355-Prymnesium_polylepis.1
MLFRIEFDFPVCEQPYRKGEQEDHGWFRRKYLRKLADTAPEVDPSSEQVVEVERDAVATAQQDGASGTVDEDPPFVPSAGNDAQSWYARMKKQGAVNADVTTTATTTDADVRPPSGGGVGSTASSANETSSVLENATPAVDSSSPPGSHADEPLGSGGCTAVDLAKLGVYSSVGEAKKCLNRKMAPYSAKCRSDFRIPEHVDNPDDRWHPEVVKNAVVGSGH